MPSPALFPPPPAIRRAAVIGAGTMGAAIAAHLTNAGIPTLLLDLPATDGDGGHRQPRRRRPGRPRTRPACPSARRSWTRQRTSALLTLGNTADHLSRLAECDWIIEAIIEKPEAKQALWAAVERARPAATRIFSSNSSGIPMAVQSRGRSDRFRRRFLGAHFYNPPRYLYLLELIPTADTAPDVLEAVRAFGDRVLGKGIVLANDVPGFIGNRIGIYSLLQTARVAEEMGLPADVVDALTGPLLGSAEKRHHAPRRHRGPRRARRSFPRTSPPPRPTISGCPPLWRACSNAGRKGEKTGGGYYQRRKNADGTTTILTLDPRTMDYAERPPPRETAARTRIDPQAANRRRTHPRAAGAGYAGGGVHPAHALRNAALRRGETRDRRQHGAGHRPRAGMGFRLGDGAVQAASTRSGLKRVADAIAGRGLPVPPVLARHALRRQPFYPPGVPRSRGADGPDRLKRPQARRGRRASSAGARARASWTWATACCCWNSTARPTRSARTRSRRWRRRAKSCRAGSWGW